MNKLKKLVIPLIVMCLLIVGLVIFVIVKNSNKSSEEEADFNILTLTDDQLTRFSINRKDLPDLVIGVDLNESTGLMKYSYLSEDADPAVEYSDSSISSYLKIMCSYYANSLVASGASLSEYGLDDPEYKINFECRDGSKKTILLGHDTYDGSACYCMLEGSDKVFTVAKLKKSYADYTAINFLQAQLLSIDYKDVTSVTFDRTSDKLHLVASCNSAESSSASGTSYYITEPFTIKAGTYFSSLMTQIFSLEISSYTEIADADKALYGLDNPQYHFIINKVTGEKIDIYLSSLIGDYYYGYSNITDKYFVLSGQQLSYIDMPVTSLIDEYIAYYYAYEITSITGSYNGESFKFDLEVPNNTKISDPATTIKLDNRNAKIFNSEQRSYCAVLFETLATIMIEGIDTDAKPALVNPEMTLTFITKNFLTYKIDFVKRTDNTYYVFINDKYSMFYVNRDELFADGGKDTYKYGVWPAYKLLDKAINENIGGVYDIP